ncbi:unnamed protein product [Oppiella nova]|uniref:RING-type domain-containing protein n=1 Tax=Oppiella nova TaxID=334625 RepID=A0A7R9QQ01_9ACAR|nr:unnamed protein product [Oppiella nova]CAG2170728.1 unnamed protein product [Oppiella nova]
MSGYNIDRFVNLSETERDELTCSLCLDILCCPVVSPCCSQMFCECCINEWLQTNNTCPYDRIALTKSGLTRPPSCDYKDKGCREVVKLENLTRHTVDDAAIFKSARTNILDHQIIVNKCDDDMTENIMRFVRQYILEYNSFFEFSKSLKKKLDDEFGDSWHVIAGKRYEYNSVFSYNKYYLDVVFDRLSIVIHATHSGYFGQFKQRQFWALGVEIKFIELSNPVQHFEVLMRAQVVIVPSLMPRIKRVETDHIEGLLWKGTSLVILEHPIHVLVVTPTHEHLI